MTGMLLNRWLDALGYDASDPSLHVQGPVTPEHPYSIELDAALDPGGAIRAQAVFDVEGVPTVAFLQSDNDQPLDEDDINRIRQRIWNQNLVSVVLVIEGSALTPLPVSKRGKPGETLELSEASAHGVYSAADIRSSEIQRRHPEWFQADNRVDQHLLKNLGSAVKKLTAINLNRHDAQALLGQIMFISYLEHRGIVGDTYRSERGVQELHELVSVRQAQGITKLVQKLQGDFNGDFLSAAAGHDDLWDNLRPQGFDVLEQFLQRVDLETGQGDFWNYDFSQIPVELLSGIYETFLDEEREALAAYYTPRHLANLAVDQAFADSKDMLKEVVYDGACGSGILLTTAFRRMLGVAESRKRKQLSLAQRIELLKAHIFGSDVSETACRVTAFSLYLSLLERLEPSDILALQRDEAIKLPRLRDRNLFAGETKGDFFSVENPLAGSQRFTLLISNPPWKEPAGQSRTSADEYAEAVGLPPARRQSATVFSYRALDALSDGGRMCLILPVSHFLARTSEPSVRHWLSRCSLKRLINFGDLRQLLFNASHGCVVAIAEPRKSPGIPIDETFDYWVPKADISFLLGRLTLHSADHHRLQTQAVQDDPSYLTTYMWGDRTDLALWSRLTLNGTLSTWLKGKHSRWQRRKGIHFIDRSVEPESAEPLHKLPYISADALRAGLPVFHPDLLAEFPDEIKTVARIGTAMDVFDGPRILFPDGMANDREIRATFYDQPGSFNSSIGVIAGPKQDSDLLRFLAIYLRSDLASYFLITRSYQTLCERNRVSLREIEQFPFIDPAEHPDPDQVKRVFAGIAELSKQLTDGSVESQLLAFESLRPSLNDLVFDYFGLSTAERSLVSETVRYLLPAAQPRSYKRLFTGLQHRSSKAQLQRYANRLRTELHGWRDRLQGGGAIQVTIDHMSLDRVGPIGIVRIAVGEGPSKGRADRLQESDSAVLETLSMLQTHGLLPVAHGETLQLAADTVIWHENAVYLVRPLIVRCWLERVAVGDARKIVSDLHTHLPQSRQVAS